MSKLLKLLERIKNNPKTVRFDELDKILIAAGYNRYQPRGGSSHYSYRKEGSKTLTVPRHLPFVGAAYVRDILEELGLLG